MNTENRINNYFDRVKQNPPLMDIEKVHQLINEAEVKAEVEVKKGRRNLLKFTMMTTLFAVIISAVLFWPGNNSKLLENESGSKYQDTRQVSGSEEQVGNAISDGFGKENIVTEKENKGDENKYIALAEFENSTSENRANSSIVSNNEQINQSSIVPSPQNKGKSIDFKPSTFQPIDGNPFIITADKTLLEKLGFQFRGENVFYQNKSSDGVISVLNYFKVKYDFGTGIFHRTLKDKILEDSIVTNTFDFYPVISSYKTGNIMSSNLKDGFNFEFANDTLFPICIPQGLISDDPNDIILWYKTSEDFFNRIPENNHPLSKDYNQIKRKKDQIECNLINYAPQVILNQSKFIELTDEELLKIGFCIKQYDNPFPGKKGEYIKTIEIDTKTESNLVSMNCAKNVTWNNIMYEKIEVGNNRFILQPKDKMNAIPDIWLSFTSNTKGDIIEEINKNASPEFVNLIPIKISTHSLDNILKEDIVFWFEPTDYFFKQLPERISKDLHKEYNYITAEDKSALTKPECKYFEECKNTLNASNFKVFPNPANTQATVSFTLPEAINGRITLVDLAGREKQVLQPNTNYSKGSHQFDVDVSNVPEGIYLLTLYSDKGIQTQRFIVAR